VQNPFRWPYKPLASPDAWPRLGSSGVSVPAAGAPGQRRWVIARSLCRFRHFGLPAAAGAQRRAVLRNLLLAWAPFDDPAYSIVMRAGGAFAWAWDRPHSATLLDEAGAPADAVLWPEALFVAPPAGDGLRLLRASEGVDAQLWRGGELQASRWWPEVPAGDEWLRWARSAVEAAGLDLSMIGPPQAQTLPWQGPWAEGVGIDALLSSSSRLERVALASAIAALVGLSSAQLHQAWAANEERHALQAERDRVAAAAAPVIAARDRALALAVEAAALSAQLVAPQPLEVMQHLAERLPARGATLKELDLEGTRLRIALEVAPELARAGIVKDLQAAGWFTKVSEVRDVSGRGWLGFEMQVQGLQPPAEPLRAAADAAAATAGVASGARVPAAPTRPTAMPGLPGLTP
jgi:hypothetical protein